MLNKIKRILAMGVLATAILSNGVTTIAAEYPSVEEVQAGLEKEQGTIFPIGKPNVAYEKYFTGLTFHNSLAKDSIGVSNVTFTRGAHTFWHIHHGSCQILVPENGRGYYQIWEEEVQTLIPGVVVTIPEGIKHWHGAAPTTMMQHLSIMQVGENVSTEWLEPVDDNFYNSLK